ncbi:unnamed protein product [Anisakis simplex]|uniref:Uncharacterized protein n=1 Tax=Anisakis simplex TaxID=6269 RepID=A0A0M3JJM1_ANISI|nr:unnamed protein product [Anisakis simplex]
MKSDHSGSNNECSERSQEAQENDEIERDRDDNDNDNVVSMTEAGDGRQDATRSDNERVEKVDNNGAEEEALSESDGDDDNDYFKTHLSANNQR